MPRKLLVPQTPGKSSWDKARIIKPRSGYGADPHAPGTMIRFLAQAAKDARLAAGIKPARVAVASDVDLSTIYRFEKGRWPHDADRMVQGYADELGVEPKVIWQTALTLWQASDDLAHPDRIFASQDEGVKSGSTTQKAPQPEQG